ncbi:squalene/phytoene synthase family protein [Sorangium sp. So ce118]
MTDLAFFRATMPESSALTTGADDALKDLDNTWFLRGQPEDVRAAWFDRIRILRLVDRLAEAERLDPSCPVFAEFHNGWREYQINGFAFGRVGEVVRLWMSGHDDEPMRNAIAFDTYLDAVWDCNDGSSAVDNLAEHTALLGGVSGAMFRLLPFLRIEDRGKAHWFGILDGFFNNLRDLAEDSAVGLCYFPADVLERHGLTREDVLTGRCIGTVGWEAMMRFWLDEYLPTLRERATPFIESQGLHPSLEALRGWCLHRWRRVECVFREVGYDYRAFDVLYWRRVREELAERSEAA